MRESIIRVTKGFLWAYLIMLALLAGVTTVWLVTDFVIESRFVGAAWLAVAAAGLLVIGGMGYAYFLLSRESR